MKSMSLFAVMIVSLVIALNLGPVSAQEEDNLLEYTLSFSQAASHYIDVRLEFSTEQEQVEVMMPTWTPGSYLIREYARFVQDVQASGTRGRSLSIEKSRKNRWRIDTQGSKRVTLEYRVYCRELSVRSNWVDADLAILNGAATYLVPVDQMKQAARIRIELPAGWARSVCPLPADPESPHTYIADDFDQMVDSPVLCGQCNIYPFQVSGINHYLVNVGDDGLWDGQRAVNDLKKVVAAHHEFWQDIPYQEYYFLNVVMGGGGGLEHDNSTLIMSGRRTMNSPQSYRRWLSLCSHEFFHAWNVRRLRPRSLVEYDYENEVYTRELWIAEGLTSYYQNLLLARADLMSSADLLQSLSGDVRGTETRVGNLVQSLSDSSFDAWIDFYRPHENSANTSVSYYGRGAVAGFLLDCEIRRNSEGQRSLDDALRALYQRYRETGYTNDDVRVVCEEMAGGDLSSWFRDYIDGPGEFDYQPAFTWLGLQWGGGRGTEDERRETVTIGVTVRDTDGRARVTAIRADSSGQQAGLNLDDEIVAVGDRRVNAAAFTEELRSKKPGEVLSLLIARRQVLRNLDVEVLENPQTSWRIARSRRLSEEQESQWEKWFQGTNAKTLEKPDENSDANEADSENQESDKELLEGHPS